MSSGLVLSEGCDGRICSRPSLRLLDGHLRVHMAFSLYILSPSSYCLTSMRVSVFKFQFFFYKDSSHIGLVPTLMTSLITSAKVLSPNKVTCQDNWGWVFNMRVFWGHIIQPITDNPI